MYQTTLPAEILVLAELIDEVKDLELREELSQTVEDTACRRGKGILGIW